MKTAVITPQAAAGLSPHNECPNRTLKNNERQVSLDLQMAGRHTWCQRSLERGLEQCSPALKYVTCLQSLP